MGHVPKNWRYKKVINCNFTHFLIIPERSEGECTSNQNVKVAKKNKSRKAERTGWIVLFIYLLVYLLVLFIYLVSQLRSSFVGGTAGNRGVPASPALSNARIFSDLDDGTGVVRVTCCFAPPRGAVPLAGHALNVANSAAHRDRLQRRTAESLYVMSWHGALVE